MPKYEGINRNYEAGVWNKDEGPSEEQKKAEREKLMKEFLAKGGKVQQCEPFARTENLEVKGGFYGRKPKKKEE